MRRHPLGILGVVVLCVVAMRADAYVEVPYSLGRLVKESTNIILLQAEKVYSERNLIIYRKLADIKGVSKETVIKHNIAKAGFHPREWQTVMGVIQPGKHALFFHNGGASETCIDNYWYQCYPGGEWWNMSHAEPYLLRTYAGRPEKLAPLVIEMLAGKEVVVPCMVDGDKNALQLRAARIQRMKASMALQDYDAKRDFVGWGGEELRRITNMAGFTQIGDIGRMDPDPSGIAAADLNGDGQPDLCLWGGEKVAVLINAGNTYEPMLVPYTGGARSASFGDWNGDGKPDLLLATPQGVRLFTNEGDKFRDDSLSLPQEQYYNLSAATFIDQDADGKPDILAANGFLGLRLYRNLGDKPKPATVTISKWHWAGPFDNTGNRGFATAYPPEQGVDLAAQYTGRNGAGITWKEGNFTDGQVNSFLPLFPPQLQSESVIYVYREMTLGGSMELPVSLGSDDSLSVFVNGQRVLAENVARGCAPDQHLLTLKLRPGAYRNIGDGTFSESTGQIGLDRKIFNTRGLCVVDLNKDGIPDLAFTNEGQESAVLLSAADRLQK